MERTEEFRKGYQSALKYCGDCPALAEFDRSESEVNVEAEVSDDFGKIELQPKKGAIAFCSLNRLGLITSETPIEVTYNDGNKGISWVGIQLTDGQVSGVGGDKGKIIKQKVGDPWMTRKPKVIAYLDDVISQ